MRRYGRRRARDNGLSDFMLVGVRMVGFHHIARIGLVGRLDVGFGHVGAGGLVSRLLRVVLRLQRLMVGIHLAGVKVSLLAKLNCR